MKQHMRYAVISPSLWIFGIIIYIAIIPLSDIGFNGFFDHCIGFSPSIWHHEGCVGLLLLFRRFVAYGIAYIIAYCIFFSLMRKTIVVLHEPSMYKRFHLRLIGLGIATHLFETEDYEATITFYTSAFENGDIILKIVDEHFE